MKRVNMFNRLKTFLFNVFIGGIVILLPIVVMVKLILWLIGTLMLAFKPISTFAYSHIVASIPISELLAFCGVFLLCFLVGMAVRTAWGHYIHGQIERRFLIPIPGYTLIRDLLSQLQKKDGGSFNRPVMLKTFQSEQFVMAYITDELDEHYAVFVPTSPSPLNGFVIFAPKQDVIPISASAQSVMNLVVGCGVGSSKVLNKANVNLNQTTAQGENQNN